MEAISSRKFLKAVFKKSLVLMTVLAVIFSSFGPVMQNTVPAAKAAISAEQIIFGNMVNLGASAANASVFGINLAAGASEKLTSIRVAVGGKAGEFAVGDLAAMSTGAGSGLALYSDSGSSNGVMDGTDAVVTLASAPSLSATRFSKLTPTAAVAATDNSTALAVGDLLFTNVGGSMPGYSWNIVTTAGTGPADSALRLNSNTTAPAYPGGAKVSKFTPATTGTYTINGTANTVTPALAVGDVVYYHLTPSPGNGNWGVVTTALAASAFQINGGPVANGTYRISKIAADAGSFTVSGTATIVPTGTYTSPSAGDIVYYAGASSNGWGIVTNATLTSGTFAINNVVLSAGTYGISKITAYSPAPAVITDTSPVITAGDVAFSFPVMDPWGNSYSWHMATTGGNGPANTDLRMDNNPNSPKWAYLATLTPVSPGVAIPADDAGANQGADFFVTVSTAVSPVSGHRFSLGIPYSGDVGISAGATTVNQVMAGFVEINTAALTIQSVTGFPGSGSRALNVRFSKPVQTTPTGGALTIADFALGNPGSHTFGSATINHTAGTDFATITLAEDLAAGDFSTPATLAAASATAIYDLAGNAMGTTPVNFTSPLTITNTALPMATVGIAYTTTLQAAGGVALPASPWAMNSGTVLPTGLSLNASTGVISGTPTNAGTFNFIIQVTDNAPTVATKNFTMSISSSASGGIPAITSVSPAALPINSSATTVTITGSNTHFGATSTVTLSGSATGVTIGAATGATTATQISVPITLASTADTGARSITVTTTSPAETVTMTNGFTVLSGATSGLTLQAPSSGATNVPLPPNFNFSPSTNASVNSYEVIIKQDGAFTGTALWDYVFPKPADANNTNGSHCNSTSCNVRYGEGMFKILTQAVPLAQNTTYYWQVKTFSATPFDVTSSSVALETTTVSSFTTGALLDTASPAIMHRPVFQAKLNTDLYLFARVMDNVATESTTPALTTKIFYCSGSSSCNPTTEGNVGNNGVVYIGSGYYKYKIPAATITNTENTVVRYFLRASDGTNTQDFYQTGTTPFQLAAKPLTGSGAISGFVKDSASTCAAGVQTATVFAEGTGFNVNSDGSCNYAFANLPAGTYDLVAFKSGYGDRMMNGIASASSNINFSLMQGAGGGMGGDTTRPRVKFTGPMDGMNGMPGNDSNFKVFAVFDKAMSQTAVTTTGNLTVNTVDSSTGNLTPITTGSWTYYSTAPAGGSMLPPEANMAAWSLTSPNTLGDNKTIAVVISSNVTDTAGNAIQGNQSNGNYVFSFTTGSTANFTGFNSTTGTFSGGGTFGSGAFMPPHVNGTNPAPGSSDVFRNAKLTINFSDPMADDGGGYALANNIKLFTLSGAGAETEVTSAAINTVTLDTAKMNATVNLKTTYNTYNSAGSFAAGARYRLKVLGGAKAASGMTIASPDQATNSMFTSEFTVRDKAVEADEFDSGAPTIVGSYPNTDDANVPTTLGAVNVAFSKDMDASTITTGTLYLSVGSTSVNGTVEYRALERQAFFMPKSALSPNTTYTINVTTSVKAANGTAIGTAVARTFTTGAADTTAPAVSFVNADDYYLAITFSKPMNSISAAAGATDFLPSVLKPGNLAIGYGVPGFVAPGTAVTIPATASFSYDPATNTLSVQGYNSVAKADLVGKEILVTLANVKDVGGVAIGSNNTGRAPIKDSATTKGALGPMATTGSAFDMGGGFVPTNFSSNTFGFAPPIEVRPFNMMAGKTTIYGIRIPISRQIAAGGQIVLTFPTGFDVSAAQQDINSPMRTDFNGPMGSGTVTFRCQTAAAGTSCGGGIGAPLTGDTGGDTTTKGGLADDGVIVNTTSRTVTVYLSADTTAEGHDFLTIDISGIKNSTVPKDFNTSGYTVDVKTKSADGSTVIESLTSMPFFIQGVSGTSYTLRGTVTATSNDQAGTMKVYLISPMTGSNEATTVNFSDAVSLASDGATKATYSFTDLQAGDYMLFTDQTITLDTLGNGVLAKEFVGKTMPERVVINETADTTDTAADGDTGANDDNVYYDLTLASNASGTAVTVAITGGIGKALDVFAGSPTGFKVKQVTPSTSPQNVTLNLGDGQWYVGVGPQMPKGMMAGPPPTPDYLPPKPIEVGISGGTITENSGTANNGVIEFTLTLANKTIKGVVKDGSATPKVMANAEVYAYSPSNSGDMGGFGTRTQADSAGNFTLNVVDGSYIVGSFVPGMPPSKEVPVTVNSDPNKGGNATNYLFIDGATAGIAPATAATTFILKVAKPDYTISGKVTDGTNVVQGASVYAYRNDGPGFANANTDSSGSYTLYVSTGTWKVGTFLPQYGQLAEQTVPIAAANASNINFSPSLTGTFYTVSGRVWKDTTPGGTYNSGEELAGVFVRLTGNTFNETISSADGTYSFKVPAGNGYIVKAFSPAIGELPPLTAFDVSADVPNKNIVVTAPSTITVTLSGAVAKAFIEIFSTNGVGARTEIANTTTGTLSLPNGTYQIRVDIPGMPVALTNIADNPDDVLTTVYDNTKGLVTVDGNEGLKVTLASALRTVSGTVVDTAAKTISDAWVEVFNSTNGVHFGTKSLSDGTFSIQVAGSTTYTINAMKPGYFRDASQITVAAANLPNQTLTLGTASTTIQGQVFIGSAGAANAFIRAEKQGGGFAGTQADANGNYTLYVASGVWRVFAVADGYAEAAFASNPIDVAAGSVSGKNITLTTQVTLAAPKSKPFTPANGGTLEDTTAGVKLTIPANALGTSTSAGNVQVKETNNVRETSSAKPLKKLDSSTGSYVAAGKDMKATDSSGSPITNFNDSINIEMTYTKAELAATASNGDSSIDTKTESDKLKMAYWDETTANWVTLPSTLTYKNASNAIMDSSTSGLTPAADLSNVSAVTITAPTTHFSLYAPVSSTDPLNAPSTPSGLAATAASTSQINLSWTQVSGATSYDIYRNTSATGTFTRTGSEPTVSSGSTTTYSDSAGLSASTTYYYKITALNAYGESAASDAAFATTNAAPSSGGGGGGAVAYATTVPTNGSVIINSGASTANSKTVTLTISATNAVSMAISNTSDFDSAIWETYANSKSWQLTDTAGTKTVYVKFRNSAGDSAAYSDTIVYDPNAVIATTPATTTPATTPTTPATTSYPDGTLLKSTTDPKVYVVQNGEKVWIETAAKFNAAGYKWTDVKTVSAEVIKQVGVVNLLRAEGDTRVYVVKNNIKRHVASPAEFTAAGYKWADVVVTTPAIVAGYPDAAITAAAVALYRAEGDYKVYVIKDGAKQWIKTAAEFNAAGYKWADVQAVAKSQVDAYPETTAVTVKVVNTPTLRVRTSNTTASGILGRVSQNETFTILEEKNNWYKIKTNTGVTGWISGAYAVKQ